MDNELYDMCLKVYRSTAWDSTTLEDINGHRVPLYTSDFLLEKLPAFINHWITEKKSMKLVFKMRQATTNKGHWRVGYYNSPTHQENKKHIIESVADTPLKALLKLTLELHKTGKLK